MIYCTHVDGLERVMLKKERLIRRRQFVSICFQTSHELQTLTISPSFEGLTSTTEYVECLDVL